MIFTNCPVCTIFERTINPSTRMEEYTPHYFYSVYWEEKRGASSYANKSGVEQKDSLLVMLGGVIEYVPKAGDIVAAGEVFELPERRFTVTQVFDAQYGTYTPHIEVRAE